MNYGRSVWNRRYLIPCMWVRHLEPDRESVDGAEVEDARGRFGALTCLGELGIGHAPGQRLVGLGDATEPSSSVAPFERQNPRRAVVDSDHDPSGGADDDG